MAERIRILLIDDHALVREGIARLLTSQPDLEVVGEAATVDEGIELVKNTPVDLVLLDINLGTHQGGAFLKMARAEGFQGRVLVVTAGISKLEAKRLLETGYAGIFLKHDRPPVLIDKIRAIVAGVEPPAFKVDSHATLDQTSHLPFTPRERQVLRGIFAGQTNKEIAYELKISEPLVKAVVQQLFNKAGVRSRAQLVRIAVEKYWRELEDLNEPSS
jgi:DNA-binding NarL/FixJ family response regulator